MKKMLRRILALMVALALCSGQIAIPAMAAETVTGTGTPEDPKVTVTVTVEENGSTTTVTKSDWSSEDSQTDSSSTEGPPSVSVNTEITTTVEGSETITENTSSSGNTTTIEGSQIGWETTDVEGTTVTTTETKDVLITETDTSVTETLPGSDVTEGNGDADWIEGTPLDNPWVEGDPVPGPTDPAQATEETTSAETVPLETPDLTDESDVVLNLTPGGGEVSAEKKVTVTLEDVLSGNVTLPTEGVTELRNEKNELIGWTITQDPIPSTESEPFDTDTPDTGWVQVGDAVPTPVEPQSYPEDTDPNDNVTTEVEMIYDDDGNYLGYRVITTTVTETPADTAPDTTELDSASVTVVDLQRPEESSTTDENGNTIQVTVTELMQDGVLAGYTTTTVVTDKDGNHVSTEKNNIYGSAKEADSFTAPDAPQGGVTTDENGNTVTTTVEEIWENGTLIGYQSTSVTTDPAGEVVFTETKKIYGTTTSKDVITVTTPESEETLVTRVTTTDIQEIYLTKNVRQMERIQQEIKYYNTTIVTESDTYQLVTGADGGLYFLYKGQMFAVVDNLEEKNTLTENLQVASGQTVSMTGYGDADDLRMYGDTTVNIDPIDSFYTGEKRVASEDGTAADNKWTHVGRGLVTDFVADGTTVQMFMIQDGSEVRYVYCVELDTSAPYGTYYSKDYQKGDTSENESTTSPWQGANGNIAQLRSVAVNGFWGTANGLGSLQAVKDLMQRNQVDQKYIDNLSVGMAVVATQAALWEFGSPNSRTDTDNDGYILDSDFVTWDDSQGTPTDLDKETIKALRNLLVELATQGTGPVSAEILEKEDITGAAITLHNKALDESGNVKTSNGKELYTSDLSFKLDVSTSSINGDLLLEITDADGREIAKRRLSGANSNWLSFATIHPDANGVYTLKNVELAEDVIVTLRIRGIQHVDDGIFIYQGDYQDFIGLSQMTNEVDLTVDLQFTVEDPQIQHTHTVHTQPRTDTITKVKTDTRTDTQNITQTVTSGDKVTDYNVKVYGTVTVTETKKETTHEERYWEAYWTHYLTDEGDGGERIELADAPKTGDITELWMGLSLISLVGMILLGRKREEA